MTTTAPVVYSVSEGVGHLELNRPESFNALSVPLADALAQAAGEAAQDDDVKVVLLSGRGRAFCAGGDVKMMSSATDVSRDVLELATAVHAGILALATLGKPVVGVVHGSVAGGGLGLSCVADLLLAAESTTFLAAYPAIAVSPDCSATWALPRIVGTRRAMEILLLNRPFGAAQATDWGLVTSVHPDSDVLDQGLSLARRLAADPAAAALGRTRALVRDAAERTLAAQLDVEAASIAELVGTEASKGLVAAFANR